MAVLKPVVTCSTDACKSMIVLYVAVILSKIWLSYVGEDGDVLGANVS